MGQCKFGNEANHIHPFAGRGIRTEIFSKAFAANNAATSATVTVSDRELKSLDKLTITCVNGNAGIMATSSWTENSLKFKLEEESAITLSAQMSWGNGGSCIAYDHFTLTQLPEGSLDPDAPSIEGGTEDQVDSPTEGVISHEFVEESAMQQDLLQMLANSLTYAHNIWYDCAAPNSKDEACGYLKPTVPDKATRTACAQMPTFP